MRSYGHHDVHMIAFVMPLLSWCCFHDNDGMINDIMMIAIMWTSCSFWSCQHHDDNMITIIIKQLQSCGHHDVNMITFVMPLLSWCCFHDNHGMIILFLCWLLCDYFALFWCYGDCAWRFMFIHIISRKIEKMKVDLNVVGIGWSVSIPTFWSNG